MFFFFKCKLFEAPPFEKYEWSHKLGDLNLSGTIHEINASLGLQLAYAWLAKCKKRKFFFVMLFLFRIII